MNQRVGIDIEADIQGVKQATDSTAAGVDMYSAGTYDGQLLVSYNSHGPEPQRYVAEIRDLLKESERG